MKIGFIGAGNMTTAIIKGLLASGKFNNQEIFLTASTTERSKKKADDLTVQYCENNQQLISTVDMVILGVKPQVMPSILAEIAPSLKTSRIPVISIAAGLTLAMLASSLEEVSEPKIIRVMPNMNVAVRQGVSAITGNDFISDLELEDAQAIFNTVGSSYVIQEKDFQNFTSLAGCSPAYTYLFIDAMSRAGVKNGLPKDLATKIATEAVLGSAAMLKENPNETPWDLIDKVCSPGGTTVAGLVSLENDAFTASVIRALDATIQRDRELSE